jgi:TolB-like protein
MIYRFGAFELDTARVELRTNGVLCPLEPQVFSLLALLVENRERLVSKAEIVEKVWDGRAISDAAIASRIKSVRKALGDDGSQQRFIRTMHGRGFRFVADATAQAGADSGPILELAAQCPGRQSRPSIAVLPFRLIAGSGPYAAIADALPHELISELSRLRWLFVTARGSSFRLRGSDLDTGEVGRLLGVRYCLSGTLEVTAARLAVTVELVDTRDSGVVWSEHFAGPLDEVHQVRETIRAGVLAALEIQVPLHEAALARLTVTEDLDAWSAYHIGLQHLYRFNRADNAAASAMFRHALTQDPAFARAHAGLSFVHFQTAFMQHTDDRAGEILLARSAHCADWSSIRWTRSSTSRWPHVLARRRAGEQSCLARARDQISPNYAQGIYACSWTESLAGRVPVPAGMLILRCD